MRILLGLVGILLVVGSIGVLGRPGKHHGGDLETAAGHHHGGYGNGRVQIKVYRGQSKPSGHGGGHYGGYDTFAPYGYWVRQPPDNQHHGWHSGY